MKLLYLADIRFPMERANGIQTVETAHALARRGVEVHLVVRRTDARSEEDCLAFFGLEPHPNLRLERVAVPLGRASYLARVVSLFLRASRWDVLYTRDLVIGALALRAALPVVYEAHTVASVFAGERAKMYGNEAVVSRRKLARLDARERRVCRHAAGVVAITSTLREALEARHAPVTEIEVVPDGCRLPTVPPDPYAPHAPLRVYYIGQLYPWKGADVLVEAMSRVAGAELVVVGGLPPEPDLDRLKRLASELGLEGRVAFRGFLPPPELPAERERADVFAIPLLDSETARWFTSPLKLFEAMAARRPIVASDLPSIREVLRHEENALLVPPGEPEELARAIARIAADPELGHRLGERAHADVADYSWDRRAERLAAFLGSHARQS